MLAPVFLFFSILVTVVPALFCNFPLFVAVRWDCSATAAAVAGVAAYFTCFDAAFDYVGVDQIGLVTQAGVSDYVNPVLAGASTGLLYKSMGASMTLIQAYNFLFVSIIQFTSAQSYRISTS